jgi:hypothetical protein
MIRMEGQGYKKEHSQYPWQFCKGKGNLASFGHKRSIFLGQWYEGVNLGVLSSHGTRVREKAFFDPKDDLHFFHVWSLVFPYSNC